MRRKNTELVCVLTGVKILATEKQIIKQVQKLKLDSNETYIKYYVSLEARKLLKQGLTENQIRRQFNCKCSIIIPFEVLKCYVKKFKTKKALERKRKKIMVEEFYKDNKREPYEWKGTQIINLTKNKEYCEELTQFACWRPDIYLDLGCKECILNKNCQCPIKDLKRTSGDRRRKRQK